MLVLIAGGCATEKPVNSAEAYQQALAAEERQQYSKALELYRMAAASGHAHAEFKIGTFYERGLAVPQDYAKAVEWYGMSAEHGDAAAKYNIGNMYLDGVGLPQDWLDV
jgi:TPR repeat protein